MLTLWLKGLTSPLELVRRQYKNTIEARFSAHLDCLKMFVKMVFVVTSPPFLEGCFCRQGALHSAPCHKPSFCKFYNEENVVWQPTILCVLHKTYKIKRIIDYMVYITLPLLRETEWRASQRTIHTVHRKKWGIYIISITKIDRCLHFCKKKKKKNRILFTIRTHFVEV